MAPLKKESKKATSAGRSVSEKHRQNGKVKTNAALTQDAYKTQETASKSRKLTKASIPKDVRIPTSWAQQAESEDNNIRWGPELPTPAQIGQLHGRGEGRNLTSWREHRLLERLLVIIDSESRSEGLELPWAKIGHRLSPGTGPQAVQQFLDRTYNSLLNEGHLVPPPHRKHQSFSPEIRGFVRDDASDDGVRPVPYWENFQNPSGPRSRSSNSKKSNSTIRETDDSWVEAYDPQTRETEFGSHQRVDQTDFDDQNVTSGLSCQDSNVREAEAQYQELFNNPIAGYGQPLRTTQTYVSHEQQSLNPIQHYAAFPDVASLVAPSMTSQPLAIYSALNAGGGFCGGLGNATEALNPSLNTADPINSYTMNPMNHMPSQSSLIYAGPEPAGPFHPGWDAFITSPDAFGSPPELETLYNSTPSDSDLSYGRRENAGCDSQRDGDCSQSVDGESERLANESGMNGDFEYREYSS